MAKMHEASKSHPAELDEKPAAKPKPPSTDEIVAALVAVALQQTTGKAYPADSDPVAVLQAAAAAEEAAAKK